MNTFKQRWKTILMHRRDATTASRIVWIALLVIIFSTVNLPGGEVDRLLVAVNGTVITEGDLYIARNLNMLFSRDNKIDPVSPKEEIERLIELELIRQEMKNLSMDLEDEDGVNAWMMELRDLYAGEGGLIRLLEQLGLQESELISFLKLEISILRFVDFRFRPFAPKVSVKEIEAYYHDRFLPQLRESGLEIPPLTVVSTEIEEILKEVQVNADLDQWIMAARRNARIEYFTNSISPVDANVPQLENSLGLFPTDTME